MSRLTEIEKLIKYAPAQDGEVRIWRDTHRHMRLTPGVWRDLDTGEVTDDNGDKLRDDPREIKPRGVVRTAYEKVMAEPPSFVGKHELWNEVCSRVQVDGKLSYGDAIAEYARVLSNRLEGTEVKKEWSNPFDELNFKEVQGVMNSWSLMDLKVGSEKFINSISKIDFESSIMPADFGDEARNFFGEEKKQFPWFSHPYFMDDEKGGLSEYEYLNPSMSIIDAMLPRMNENFKKVDFDDLVTVKDYLNTCKYNRIGMTELSAFQFYRGLVQYDKVNKLVKDYKGDLEMCAVDLSVDTGKDNPNAAYAGCLMGMAQLLIKLPRFNGKTHRMVNVYAPQSGGDDPMLKIMSKFQEGKIVKFNQFTSAGKSPRWDFHTEVKNNKKSPYQKIHFDIDAYAAPDASVFSQMYGECIYHPAQKFLVNEVTHSVKTGIYRVNLLQYGGAD